ncbi:MAG TPA: SGNH/GDSL hydrolase family protein [Pseudomonadales bacterium]|nr:SGNH/GDSL hydrolase family protein [Pseudomonadales bacterium]
MKWLWENRCRLFYRLVFMFFLLEGFSRVWLYYICDDEHFLKYAALNQLSHRDSLANYRFSFHRYLGYTTTPQYVQGENRHNTLGFRGDDFPLQKPAGEYRIVCIGGSTTYTSEVKNYHDSYPAVLEKKLHEQGFTQVRVINAGVGGWHSWESLINFQFRLLDLQPDLIVVYEGINDIEARLVWPATAYAGDNSGYLQPQLSAVFMPALWEYSTLLRSTMIYTGRIQPHASLPRAINKKNETTYFGDEFARQRQQGIYPQGIFRTVSAMEMLKTNKPVYFERNIGSMIDIASSNGIKTLLLSFPTDAEDFPDVVKSASPEYVYAIAEQNAVLQKLAEKKQVRFFDLAKLLPKHKSLFKDGHHVNEAGAATMATMIADEIGTNILHGKTGNQDKP